MKYKQTGKTGPDAAGSEWLSESAEKSGTETELLVFIWPPIIQLYGINGTTRKILLFIWCIMLMVVMLLLALGIPSKTGTARNTNLSIPSGYPPAEMCR